MFSQTHMFKPCNPAKNCSQEDITDSSFYSCTNDDELEAPFLDINSLPPEILLAILSHCTSRELVNLTPVCRKWYEIIHSSIRFNINLGSHPLRNKGSDLTTQELKQISKLGVRSLQVGDKEEIYYDLLPPFRYPEVVRNLSITGTITDYSFFQIISPLSGLQKLSLHFDALKDLTITRNHLKSFRVLKTLTIRTNSENPSSLEGQVKTVLKNCKKVLQYLRSSRLEKLLLDIPFCDAYEEEINLAILDCLLNHCNTIKCLQIYYGLVVAPQLAARREPEALKMYYKHRLGKILSDLERRELHRVQLKRASIASPSQVNNFAIWSHVIQKQSKLEELFYLDLSIEGVAEGCRCIQMNRLTLTKVLLHVGDLNTNNPNIVLDGSVFSDCVNLTHVLVRGRRLTATRAGPEPDDLHLLFTKMPKFRNAKELPKRLVLLSIRDMEVEGWDLHETLEGMDKLQKLRCMDIGTTSGNGMLATDFWDILEARRIQEIEILRAVNRESVNEVLLKKGVDHLKEHVIKFVKSTQVYHVELNEEGGYTRKEEPMFVYDMQDLALRANDVCDVVFNAA